MLDYWGIPPGGITVSFLHIQNNVPSCGIIQIEKIVRNLLTPAEVINDTIFHLDEIQLNLFVGMSIDRQLYCSRILVV